MFSSFFFSLLALKKLNTCRKTKTSKKILKCTPVSGFHSSIYSPIELSTPNNSGMKRTTDKTTIWKMACRMMFLHIRGVMIYSFLEYGILSKSYSEGGSVAKAKAANVSIIRLTHSIWTGVKGDYLIKTSPKKAMNISTILTVSWNCKNFLIQSKIFLPYLAAVTILPKLSSNKMMPAAYFAI